MTTLPEEPAKDPNDDQGAQSPSGAPSAFNVMEKDDLKGHLFFWTRENWKGDVPSDQNELRIAFDDVCAVLRARFEQRNPNKFRAEFGRLLTMAHATFASDFAQNAFEKG